MIMNIMYICYGIVACSGLKGVPKSGINVSCHDILLCTRI